MPNIIIDAKTNTAVHHKAAVLFVLLVSFLALSNRLLAAESLRETDLDSRAAKMIKVVPKEIINAPKAKQFSMAAKYDDDLAVAKYIEEIRVYGEREPEDMTGPKLPPMLAFRDKLEREKTYTPKEITMMGLCFIGLCGLNYGPDGAPVEDRAFTRGEKGTNKSSLKLSRQFRGTYQ